MKKLVIAQSIQWFLNHVKESFYNEVVSLNRSCGRALLTDGTELIYISSEEQLRGHHGVEVEIWSLPYWYLRSRDADALITLARLV